jgi:hypothetical protein
MIEGAEDRPGKWGGVFGCGKVDIAAVHDRRTPGAMLDCGG